MSSEVATLSESFAADIALERLFSRVAAHMDFQSAWPHKAVVTELALERPVSRMSPEVIRQMSVRRKCPPTVVKRAGKRLLSIVDTSVSLQVAFFCELFTAAFVVADKRLFSHLFLQNREGY